MYHGAKDVIEPITIYMVHYHCFVFSCRIHHGIIIPIHSNDTPN